jgi:hypothetical protein
MAHREFMLVSSVRRVRAVTTRVAVQWRDTAAAD